MPFIKKGPIKERLKFHKHLDCFFFPISPWQLDKNPALFSIMIPNSVKAKRALANHAEAAFLSAGIGMKDHHNSSFL